MSCRRHLVAVVAAAAVVPVENAAEECTGHMQTAVGVGILA